MPTLCRICVAICQVRSAFADLWVSGGRRVVPPRHPHQAGWKVNAELPGTAGFAGATSFVRPEDVAESIPCGPDVDAIVEAVREYEAAGFTDVAVVHVGDAGQEGFLEMAEKELLPALRG